LHASADHSLTSERVARLTEQDSKIAAQELLNVQLMQELAALRSRLEPSDVEMDEDHSNAGENQSNTSAEDVDKHIAGTYDHLRHCEISHLQILPQPL
jgi:hypothetical protein